ncbi:hypothetical protein CF319_g3826 [Tilletia indica]|nr:hypothetical protein CF319_g3826 [Tilletia indica]
MPLIVKIKRPGQGVHALPGAPPAPTTPTTETLPSLSASSIITHSHSADSHQQEQEIAMGEPISVKSEHSPAPLTPGLNTEDLKSPIDTAMQDSTPITEQSPAFSQERTPAPAAAAVDILIAPSCLKHTYVRSHQISGIVERPERLRAVLLGIAGTIGRVLTNRDIVPELRSGLAPLQKEEEGGGDDLASALEGMSLSKIRGGDSAVNVWLCSRALAIQPPHPAVAFVHAHPGEEVLNPLLPEYAAAQGITSLANLTQGSDEKVLITTKEEGGIPGPPERQDGGVTYASYLAELCRLAPNSPPDRGSDDPDRTMPGPHPLEVPNDYPQGDLYLHGPSNGGSLESEGGGGSEEAIRHALGACAEAVDRVVQATTSTQLPTTESQHLAFLPLPEDAFQYATMSAAPAPGVAPAPAPSRRNFVLTRPPGHHCSGNQPAGFCWASNAVVAASHAYIQHGIDRVVILDIDLHHGNGTQALVWRINKETAEADALREERIAEIERATAISHSPKTIRHGGRKSYTAPHDIHSTNLNSTLDQYKEETSQQPTALGEGGEAKAGGDVGPRGLKIFYGSLHDIESYPCEEGNPELVRDASTCIEGAHSQWIWNVHLDSYASETEFDNLYTQKYSILFPKARRFLQQTNADPSKTLILLSTGFDACTHEYSSMSRHGRSVPVSFYSNFARDAVMLAEEGAGGKVVGILEGGYSDRALCSGALAFVGGLAGYTPPPPSESGGGCADWWDLDSLLKLEKAASKSGSGGAVVGGVGTTSANGTPVGVLRKKGKALSAANPAWLQSAMAVFGVLERGAGLRGDNYELGVGLGGMSPASGRVLRDRTKGRVVSGSAASSPAGSPAVNRVAHKIP